MLANSQNLRASPSSCAAFGGGIRNTGFSGRKPAPPDSGSSSRREEPSPSPPAIRSSEREIPPLLLLCPVLESSSDLEEHLLPFSLLRPLGESKDRDADPPLVEKGGWGVILGDNGGGVFVSFCCGWWFSSPVPGGKRPGVRSRSPQPRSFRVIGRMEALLMRHGWTENTTWGWCTVWSMIH